ncbi:MAG: Type 1 glutamine amidotransferase-like domain-containing protein [Rhizonema sp. NSF051]|nr:Type 1 glutamine amidotransferase-like domain-containing protein [Rhizonema sp. NSF051]
MNLLFLSNQNLSKVEQIDEAIISLFQNKKNKSIAYFPSQTDFPKQYLAYIEAYYKRLGIKIDVYFDTDKQYNFNLLETALKCDAIHLSGGYTFHFWQNIVQKNLIKPLTEFAKNDGIFIGVSAGAIMMTPKIDSSLLCGDPIIEGLSTKALGFVNWEFVPHANSIQEMHEKLLKYSESTQNKIFACSDGGGIMLNNNSLELMGNISTFENGILSK